MIRRYLLILCCFLLGYQAMYAQSPARPMVEDPTLKQRLVYGGTFFMFFGNISNIELMPVVGLRQSNRLSFMAGPTYSYYSNLNFNYSDNGYGLRGLGRFFLTNHFFLQAESHYLSFGMENNDIRLNHNYIKLGGGTYRNGSTFELLYIVNNPPVSRFLIPFAFRVGFYIY
jgi:hypothetical protein